MESIRLQLMGANRLTDFESTRLKERVMLYLFDQGIQWSSISWTVNNTLKFESDIDLSDPVEYWMRRLNNYIELSACYLIPENLNRRKSA